MLNVEQIHLSYKGIEVVQSVSNSASDLVRSLLSSAATAMGNRLS